MKIENTTTQIQQTYSMQERERIIKLMTLLIDIDNSLKAKDEKSS
jgi:hypothetical protein